MNVLSLFDGMSCGQIALNRLGVNVDNYFASEVDKWAIKVTQANYPNTIQLGDVEDWRTWDIDWSTIDLLMGGSPCQGFSFAGKQLAFDDSRSKLFFVYVDILNHIRKFNPDAKFLLENVRMKKEFLDVISGQLGVEPVFINSALVSAQNRQRYYWAEWGFDQPTDKGTLLKDIVEGEGVYVDREKSNAIIASIGRTTPREYFHKQQGQMVFVDREKSYCIDASYYKGANWTQYLTKSRRQLVIEFIDNDYLVRKLTPIECERLQTVLQYIKRVEIVLCCDQAKSFVSVVEKNPKLLKLVSSAESEELKECAKLAIQSMNASQAPIKHIAHQNADMQTRQQTEKCTNINRDGLNLIASSVGNTTTYKQVENVESSVIQTVFINITEGRITHHGKEESRLTEQNYTELMNGKIALNLCGGETMENAKDALSALEMMQTNQHSTSITSFRLSTKNIEQTFIISYWFAKSAIDGFIQGTTKTKTLYLNLVDGYTNHVSNTQRYKMLGNGWTVDVICHILKSMNGDME